MAQTLKKDVCRYHLIDEPLVNLQNRIAELASGYSGCACIVDERLRPLFEKEIFKIPNLRLPLISIPSGEKAKNWAVASQCFEELMKLGMDRKSLLFSLGGGATSDLAGFVASCYLRGIDIIHIPTTLLAMVDASIGGKTGINFVGVKNIIGTFHQPKHVILYPPLLKTLPDREYRAGLAEIIKTAVIHSESFFADLESQMTNLLKKEGKLLNTVIEMSCSIKSNIVKQDEKDHTVRMQLNYGHTFAHAIETATNHLTFLHGEAVSIGMSCAAYVAKQLGYVDHAWIQRQDALCLAAGLPIKLPNVEIDTLMHWMDHDKKTVFGKINLIVPQKIGKVITATDVNRSFIKNALAEKRQQDQIGRT